MNLLKLSKKEINYTLFGLVLGGGTYRKGVIQMERKEEERALIEWLENLAKSLRLTYQVMEHEETYQIKIRVPSRRHFENNRLVTASYKKVASKYALRRITPFGLFLWFLSAGKINVFLKNEAVKRYGYLKTETFNKNEHIQMQKMFQERFLIETKIHQFRQGEKEKYRIYFNATNLRKFIDLIRDYIPLLPPQLRQTFNMRYESDGDGAKLAENYNFE